MRVCLSRAFLSDTHSDPALIRHRNSFRITEAPVMEKIMTKEQRAAWDVFCCRFVFFFAKKHASIRQGHVTRATSFRNDVKVALELADWKQK